jgi:hypothetical protein
MALRGRALQAESAEWSGVSSPTFPKGDFMEIIFNSIDEMIEYIKVSLPKGAKVTLRSGGSSGSGDAEQPAYKPRTGTSGSFSRGPKPSGPPRASTGRPSASRPSASRPSTGKPPAKSKKPFAPKSGGSKRGTLNSPGKFGK